MTWVTVNAFLVWNNKSQHFIKKKNPKKTITAINLTEREAVVRTVIQHANAFFKKKKVILQANDHTPHTSHYRSVKTGLFHNLTSLPHKMPQVSTARLVLASANLRKLLHSSEGTDSCRRASTIVSGGEKCRRKGKGESKVGLFKCFGTRHVPK